MRTHLVPPKWVTDNFVKRGSEDFYDCYQYFTGNSERHTERELTIMECDAKFGWRVVVGECSASYGGNKDSWHRSGIGTMLDLAPIRPLFEWYQSTSDYVWGEKSLKQLGGKLLSAVSEDFLGNIQLL